MLKIFCGFKPIFTSFVSATDPASFAKITNEYFSYYRLLKLNFYLNVLS